jgi:hypothetical protein
MPRTAHPSIARARSTARWSSTAREDLFRTWRRSRIFRSQTCVRPPRTGRVAIRSGAAWERRPASVIVLVSADSPARSVILLLVLKRTPAAE